jgi:hypothetical protein
MSTFVTTYLLFWLAVALYVMRLGSQQRKLLARKALLESASASAVGKAG